MSVLRDSTNGDNIKNSENIMQTKELPTNYDIKSLIDKSSHIYENFHHKNQNLFCLGNRVAKARAMNMYLKNCVFNIKQYESGNVSFEVIEGVYVYRYILYFGGQDV